MSRDGKKRKARDTILKLGKESEFLELESGHRVNQVGRRPSQPFGLANSCIKQEQFQLNHRVKARPIICWLTDNKVKIDLFRSGGERKETKQCIERKEKKMGNFFDLKILYRFNQHNLWSSNGYSVSVDVKTLGPRRIESCFLKLMVYGGIINPTGQLQGNASYSALNRTIPHPGRLTSLAPPSVRICSYTCILEPAWPSRMTGIQNYSARNSCFFFPVLSFTEDKPSSIRLHSNLLCKF